MANTGQKKHGLTRRENQNKNKTKKGTLPKDMIDEDRYMAARTVGDEWICYPWEATDIDEHDELSRQMKAKQANGSS